MIPELDDNAGTDHQMVLRIIGPIGQSGSQIVSVYSPNSESMCEVDIETTTGRERPA
jgi:hypothetical protein